MFVGRAHTASGLHRDALGTRFWMTVLHGTKAFRLVDPHDSLQLKRRRLTPCDRGLLQTMLDGGRAPDVHLASESCHGYRFDLFSGRGGADGRGSAPVTDGAAVVWEANVSAGELIFIPEFWAHQVRNLDDSIAISGNFVDEYNLDAHLELLLGQFDLYRLAASESSGARRRQALDAAQSMRQRLAQWFFEREEKRFPRFAYDDVPSDDASETSWQAYFENNRRSATSPEAYRKEMQHWEREGGVERMFKSMRENAAFLGSRVQR